MLLIGDIYKLFLPFNFDLATVDIRKPLLLKQLNLTTNSIQWSRIRAELLRLIMTLKHKHQSPEISQKPSLMWQTYGHWLRQEWKPATFDLTRNSMCRICWLCFPTNAVPTEHLVMHNLAERHPCCYCAKRFSSAADLEIHKVIHESATSFVCDSCSRCFGCVTNLARHKRTQQHKPLECAYPNCDEVFRNESQRSAHVSDSHCPPSTEEKQIRVDLPNDVSTGSEDELTCDFCDGSFACRDDFAKHGCLSAADGGLFSWDGVSEEYRRWILEKIQGSVFAGGVVKTNLANEPLAKNLSPTDGFQCDQCFRSFTRIRCFEKHMATHKEDYPTGRKCDHCELELTSRTELLLHGRQTHSDCLKEKCCLCGLKFFNKAQLFAHRCSCDKRRYYRCGLCVKRTSSVLTLNEHLLKTGHAAMTGLTMACGSCALAFRNAVDLRKHIANIHYRYSLNNRLHCIRCAQLFVDGVEFRCHSCIGKTDTLCNLDKIYKSCPLCALVCKTTAELRRHFVSSHRTILCEQCSFRCNSPVTLDQHFQLWHTSSVRNVPLKPVGCRRCKKSFKSERGFEMHMKLVHSFPRTCHLCKRSFQSVSALNGHNQLCHRPTKLFKCSICSMGFLAKTRLWRHRTVCRRRTRRTFKQSTD